MAAWLAVPAAATAPSMRAGVRPRADDADAAGAEMASSAIATTAATHRSPHPDARAPHVSIPFGFAQRACLTARVGGNPSGCCSTPSARVVVPVDHLVVVLTGAVGPERRPVVVGALVGAFVAPDVVPGVDPRVVLIISRCSWLSASSDESTATPLGREPAGTPHPRIVFAVLAWKGMLPVEDARGHGVIRAVVRPEAETCRSRMCTGRPSSAASGSTRARGAGQRAYDGALGYARRWSSVAQLCGRSWHFENAPYEWHPFFGNA